jgi:hypothetical protein
MESFVAAVEAILDERAKHAVLLVHTVKKCANVTMLAEGGSGNLHGIPGGLHISPPRSLSCAERATSCPANLTV